MEQYYKPVKDFFSKKVYLVLDSGGGSTDLSAICETEDEAIGYIKSKLNEDFFGYREDDTKAIEDGKDTEFYESSRNDALSYVENYKILTIFGIDINQRIYKIITGNNNIYDTKFIVTNDLDKWKAYFGIEPGDFYYFDKTEVLEQKNY